MNSVEKKYPSVLSYGHRLSILMPFCEYLWRKMSDYTTEEWNDLVYDECTHFLDSDKFNELKAKFYDDACVVGNIIAEILNSECPAGHFCGIYDVIRLFK